MESENTVYRKIPVRPTKEVLRGSYWRDKKSLQKIAHGFGCSYMTILYWMKKFRVPRRPFYLKPDITPSADLAYILGVLKGDGCTYIRTQKQVGWIQLIQIRAKFAESFERATRKIGLHPHTVPRLPHQPNRKLYYYTCANSIKFVEWYRKLTLEKIRKIVRKRWAFTKEFIRGFYESEGCSYIPHGRKGWEISIVNGNQNLLKLTDMLLRDLGFVFQWSTTGRGGRYYRLRSYDPNQNHRFMKEIAPCIKSKTPN